MRHCVARVVLKGFFQCFPNLGVFIHRTLLHFDEAERRPGIARFRIERKCLVDLGLSQRQLLFLAAQFVTDLEGMGGRQTNMGIDVVWVEIHRALEKTDRIVEGMLIPEGEFRLPHAVSHQGLRVGRGPGLDLPPFFTQQRNLQLINHRV